MKKIFLFMCILFASCANDLHFDMPQGPAGADGLSAYELWVKEVEEGRIDWDHNETNLEDFFRYLKGAKGDDGLSAYELWVEYISDNTVKNPHDPEMIWPSENNSLAYFYYFLAGSEGENGKSAYELWVEDVLKEGGIPHPREKGEIWSPEEIDLEDFWEYLRGRDGKDGEDGKDGRPGEPGTPGAVVEKVIGNYNVIIDYWISEQSEYVRTTDGSVVYTVYDKEGNVVPEGTTVTGMPGMAPGLVFTVTGQQGKFTVTKEQLPINVPSSNRLGSAIVTMGDETAVTAPNTYVPEKVEVRLRISATPYLNTSGTITVPLRVERRLEVGRAWESLPEYLTLNTEVKTLKEFRVTRENSAITEGSTPINTYNPTSILTQINYNLPRPTLRCAYYTELYQARSLNLWDGEDNYVRISLTRYYGEEPVTQQAVLLAPIQFAPLPYEISADHYITELGTSGGVLHMEGRYDVSGIDYNLLFKPNYVEEPIEYGGLIWYIPEVEDPVEAAARPSMRMQFNFNSTTGSTTTYSERVRAINDPLWEVSTVATYNASTVQTLTGYGIYFRTSGYFGTLHLEGLGGSNYIVGNRTANMNVPDIPINYSEEDVDE